MLPAFNVISMVVPMNFGGQLGMAFLGFSACHGEMMKAVDWKGNIFLHLQYTIYDAHQTVEIFRE
jgi:hypothetical protein